MGLSSDFLEADLAAEFLVPVIYSERDLKESCGRV